MDALERYIRIIVEERPIDRLRRKKLGTAKTVRMGQMGGEAPAAPPKPHSTMMPGPTVGRPDPVRQAAQAASATPKFDAELSKRGIPRQMFDAAAKHYLKQGLRKDPMEIMDELGQIQSMQKANLPGMDQVKRMSSQVGKRLVPPPASIRRKESVKMKKANLKESVKRAILIHKQRSYLQEVVRQTLAEQVRVRNQAHYLLTEGPMGGIWQGIKGAIQGAGAGRRGTDQTAFQGATQGFAQGKAQSQAASELSKAMKQVSSHKQKFNSQILKNVEVMNQYHDAVVQALQIYKQVQPALGPHAEKMGQEIAQMLGQLHYDLESEKEQLDQFLGDLKKNAPEAEKSAKDVRKQSAVAPEMGPGATSVAQPGDEGYVEFPGRRGGTQTPQGPLAQRDPSMADFEAYLKSKGMNPDDYEPRMKQAGLKKWAQGRQKLESAKSKKKKK